MKKRKFAYIAAAILVISTVTIAFSVNQSQLATSKNVADAVSNSSKEDLVDSKENTDDDMVTIVSSYTVPYTLDELIEDSTLVVSGTVTDVSEPFLIRGVGDLGEKSFTDYTVSVDRVLRGDITESSSVVIRLEGDIQDKSIIYESGPALVSGEKYILFLEKVSMGGGYNTQGDYYYIVGEQQGVFEEQDEETLKASLSMENGDYFLSQSLVEESNDVLIAARGVLKEFEKNEAVADDFVELDALEQVLLVAEENVPIDEGARLEEIKSNIKINVETGFLSQEEYDELYSSLFVYAEIVD